MSPNSRTWLLFVGALFWTLGLPAPGRDSVVAAETLLRGRIVDAESGQPLAARLYVQGAAGDWFTVVSEQESGAVPYNKQRGASTEVHTCLVAAPFRAELPPGTYRLTIEKGKEYLPLTMEVSLPAEGLSIDLPLQRWVDLAARGWYSGETHVHRPLEELPVLMQADDLNVTFPLTQWVTRAFTPPAAGNRNLEIPADLIRLDDTHVIAPRNTEYEIFSVGDERHTLGAIFALHHQRELPMGVPPVRPVAEQVHAAGGLLELDKHNWPWSMMLIPVMNVDLYELTNNHIWRTEFQFRDFGEPPAGYMNVPLVDGKWDEQGWIEYTLQNYYALLNCGFPLRPTAGTASGVHPVPLGYGRVYVQVDGDFSFDKWYRGLDAGRSFVTTGPLLETRVNQQLPGTEQTVNVADTPAFWEVAGTVWSQQPQVTLEALDQGRVVAREQLRLEPLPQGGYRGDYRWQLPIRRSTWWAVRAWEANGWEANGDERYRFAHSAPFHIRVPDRPLLPQRQEVQFLIDRVSEQLQRSRDLLPAEALAEYEHALAAYREAAARAIE